MVMFHPSLKHTATMLHVTSCLELHFKNVEKVAVKVAVKVAINIERNDVSSIHQ